MRAIVTKAGKMDKAEASGGLTILFLIIIESLALWYLLKSQGL